MNNLANIYDEKFFAKRNSLLWRSDIFCPAIMEVFNPKTLIDVGCAIGDFVQWFADHDVIAFGIEGSMAAAKYAICPDRIIYMDMRDPILHNFYCDLAMSIEVAEHIEPEFAEVYVENMTKLANNLLLTIAGPGQKGHHHVNLQPIGYWDNLFNKLNYFRDLKAEDRIEELLYAHRRNRWIDTILNNLAIYRKATGDSC